jgi:hypothetical protein
VFDPCISEIAGVDQEVVPVAVPLVPLAEFAQATDVTPMLSLAVPESVMVLVVVEYVVLFVGEAIATRGTVISGGV